MLLVKDELLVIIARFILSLLQDASAERKNRQLTSAFIASHCHLVESRGYELATHYSTVHWFSFSLAEVLIQQFR